MAGARRIGWRVGAAAGALLGTFQLVAAQPSAETIHKPSHSARQAAAVDATIPADAVPADLPPADVGPPLAAVPVTKKPGSGGGPPPAAGPDSSAAISSLAGDGIPTVALAAYKHAAAVADFARPSCHLAWTLLAGIGRVESDHGRFAGAQLLSNGTSSFKIIGIALNGHGTALIRDTDHGRLDGDTVYDRAVGPMQFIPSTWAVYGVDGDGDGVSNPFDVNDAALAAADYLCATGADLGTRGGQITAVLTYNHDAAYVAEVLALAAAYANGTAPVTLPVTAPPVLANPALPGQKAPIVATTPTITLQQPGRTGTQAAPGTTGGGTTAAQAPGTKTSANSASSATGSTPAAPGATSTRPTSKTSGSEPVTSSPATKPPTSSTSAPGGGHSTSSQPSKTTEPPCPTPSSSTSTSPGDSGSPTTATPSSSPSSTGPSSSASATPSDSCPASPSPSPVSSAASSGIPSLAVAALFGWGLLGLAARRRRSARGCHESGAE